MTCIAAVGGIATTYATATLATGVASVVFATSAAYAATYTPDQVTGDNAQTLESGDVIQLTQGAGIGAPGSPATLHFAEDNTGVTLDVTDNSNSTWNVSPIDNNAGISIVNIGRGGMLNVYNNTHEITYCAFNKKSEATLTITLGESATLNSVAPIFGWSAGQLPNPGKRTLTMGTDSTWNISLTGGESQEWLNNTDVNMSGASIALAAGKTLTFERAENSITTSSEAVKMSTIHGEGSLMVGGSSPTLTTINGHDGILFTINRGAFDFDADNTADLQISASLANGSYKGGLLKAGDGTMELTNANSSYSNAVYVTAGTLKLSGAGTAGTGALTVDSGATLELAHTQATSIRSNITLSEGATLKASGQSTLSGTSSLLGTIVLDGTSLANTGTITLGATTSFDVRALTPTNGYIVLISGGSVSGYESVSNFTGWDGDAVLSLVSGKLLLSNAALMSSDVYWNSTDSTWSEGTTYRDSSGNTVTAGVLDNIIFEGVKTTLSLGSNIGNAVELTDNTDLTLTLGQYVLQGPVDIAEGSTLTLADPFTGPQGADMLNIGNDAWTGTGRLNLTFRNTNDANHNIKLNLSSFNGEVSISGKFNLGQSVVGADARYILNNVNIWSGGNATIANDIEVGENVVFRPTGTYTFTGTVTGKEATVGTEARVVFSNAASSIDDVYVESGRSVTYNGTATGNATLFTGDTHVAAGGSITLNPSGTDNATTVGEARQYSGAIYLNGTADSVASLTYYDGSMNITEGLHIGETSDSGKAGSITVSWDKCQYVKGLYGKDATLTIDRNHDENYGNDGHDRYIVLTGAGDFTGTLNLDNSLAAENDHNFGIMVLGEDNSAHALEGAVANFVDADSKSTLIFTSSDSVISKAQFTGDSFQTDYAANATLAGLNGSNGTVYAKELTLSGSGNYSYSGGLEVAKLIVNIQGGGIQALTGNYGAVEVQSGTLTLGDNNQLTSLAVAGGTAAVTGAVTLDSVSTTGIGSLSFDLSAETVGQLTLGADPTGTLALNLTGGTVGQSYTLFNGSDYIPTDVSVSHADRSITATYAGGVVTLSQGTGGNYELVWNPEANDGIWSADASKDWTISGGSNASNFANGDSVTFGPASAAQSIAISGTVNPASITFTVDSAAYAFTLNQGAILELGTANDDPSVDEQRIFTQQGDSTVNFTGGTLKLKQRSIFDIASTVELMSDIDIEGTQKAIVKEGSGTLVMGGNLTNGAVDGFRLLVNEGNVLFASNSPTGANNILDKLLMGEGRITVAEGSLIGIGGRGSADAYMYFSINSLNYVEGGVTSKLYLDKTGSGMTMIEYCPPNNGSTDTVFQKLIGSGTGDDGNLAFLRYAGSNQAPWRITINDEREEGEQLFHGKLTIASNAWAGSGSDANMILTAADKDVLSLAVVELISQNNLGNAGNQGYSAFGLGVEKVQIAGLTTVDGMTNIGDPNITNGTDMRGSSSGARTRLVLGSGVTSSTLLINTEAGESYTFGGGIAAGISLEKAGEGSQSFSGDMSAFNGNVTLSGGTLSFASGLTVDGSRSLSVSRGTTLSNALTLNGANLSIDTTGSAEATSLASNNLTLAGGTALTLTGIQTGSISGDTQIGLFSNVGSVLGSDGSALSLVDGVEYSTYFSNITGLSDAEKAAARLQLVDGTLCLTFAGLANPEWLWDNAEGTMTWSDANADNWDNTSGASTPAGAEVWFKGAGEGLVTISGTVTPSAVHITSGEYTFTSGAIDLGGAMSISGDSTQVTLASANVVEGGTVDLQGGKLVLGTDGALSTTTNLTFSGGTLSYAAPAAGTTATTWTDFNNRIAAADGSMVRVEVQGADNAVTWGIANHSTNGLLTNNSGVNAALVNGIEKTGEGTLTLAWAQSGTSTFEGDISVEAGKLVLQSGDYNSARYNFNGDISVADGAEFMFDAHGESDNRFNFGGSISGNGTVDLGRCTFTNNSSRYGRVNITGDNSDFHGTWVLWGAGNTNNPSRIGFSNVTSMGADDATLELHGVYFYTNNNNSPVISQNIYVAEGTNQFGTSSSNASYGYTFTGTVTGEEGATLKSSLDKNTHAFTGSISGFYGTFENGGGSCSITLGGEGIASAGGEGNASVINAQYLYGKGTYIINYADETILNSAVGTNNGTGVSSTSLTHAGTGKLILANEGNLSTQALTLNNNTVQIGYVDGEGTVHNGNWAGTVAQASGTTGGTLELVAGRLNTNTALANYTGNVVVNVGSQAVEGGSSFDYGNNSASRLTSVSVNGANGGQLTNIGNFTVGGSSACTTLNATFGTGNIGTSATAGSGSTSLISQTEGSTLTLQGGAGTTINMTIDAVIDTLQEHKEANSKSYLYLTDGTLAIADPTAVTFGTNAAILSQLGIRFVGAEGGALVLSGVVDGMYIAAADDPASQTVSGYNTMQLYKAVAVERDTTFKLVLDGAPGEDMDTTLNNLMGGTGSRFVVENTGTGTAVVTLNNAQMTGIDSPDGYEDWAPDGSAGADTTFAGSISTTGGEVRFIKTGAGTLTVGGDLVASALDLAEGGLTLQGKGSEITTLTDSGETAKTLTVDGTLTLTGSDDAASVLDNSTTLAGTGGLELEGATLSLSNGSSINGLAVDVDKDSLLNAGSGSHLLSSLAGAGEINGSKATLTIDPAQNATFSGSLTGTGRLNVNEGEGATLTFTGVQGEGWDVENGGSLILQNGAAGKTSNLASLTLAQGSSTTLYASSSDASQELFTLTGNLVVEEGAVIRVETADSENFNGSSYTLGSAAGLEATEGSYTLELGTGFMRYNASDADLQYREGKVVLTLSKIERNLYDVVADSHNAHAGADLLWHADVVGTTDLKGISDAVEAAINGGSRAEANRLMAAAAGASIATLGSAFSGDVERQLRAIRNRTASMGVNQCQVNEDMPYFNAWVNAEGDYRKLDQDGTAAGYTLNSWGGTVGFDVDVNPSLTAGLALTAMYGDMDTDGPDRAEGDLDTYYVSLFARYADRAWTHTFIATVGMADASLDRTVSYAGGSYKTTGDTEGVGFGLMYEVGYVIPLNEDATACLQPVFNVAWRHTGIDSYTESGSDAALHADDQTMDVVTFGLGARFQGAVAENLYNRTALFEARALLKVDAGDRKSDLDVALLHGTGCGNIESAELGAVGVELGAGLTIPVGSDGGSLFLDGSAELRSGYTNLNGTVGYRINF